MLRSLVHGYCVIPMHVGIWTTYALTIWEVILHAFYPIVRLHTLLVNSKYRDEFVNKLAILAPETWTSCIIAILEVGKQSRHLTIYVENILNLANFSIAIYKLKSIELLLCLLCTYIPFSCLGYAQAILANTYMGESMWSLLTNSSLYLKFTIKECKVW